MITFKEFCLKMGWGYPLPSPGTQEAEDWLDKKVPNLCPLCKKDMTIRPGAVFTCNRKQCAYARMGW